MEVRCDNREGKVLSGIDSVLADSYQRMQTRSQQGLCSLTGIPGSFVDLEKSVHPTGN